MESKRRVTIHYMKNNNIQKEMKSYVVCNFANSIIVNTGIKIKPVIVAIIFKFLDLLQAFDAS